MDQLQMTLIADDRLAEVRRGTARSHATGPEPRPLPPRRRPLAAVGAAWSSVSRWIWGVQPLAPTGSEA